MSEFDDNIEAAIAKAAAGIAEAETLEEAVEWNRILSNLYYVQEKSNPQEVEAVEEPFFVADTESEEVEPTDSFEDLPVVENTTDEINVEEEDNGN